MTEPNLADTKAAVARLAEDGRVIPLTEPARITSVLNGSLEECARLADENAALRARILTARQDVWPHLSENTRRGELARDVEAALDPRPEPATA